MPPLVSIIVPCHNAERWIGSTIESAMSQTWPNREIIVINDGSDDGSLAVAKRYESRTLRVIDQPCGGATAARNAGLAAAKGEFIQYLDADDLLAPDKIEKQVTLLLERGRNNLCTCAWARFTDDIGRAAFVPQALWQELSPVEWMVTAWEHNLMMATATWLTPRESAEKAGPWNTEFRTNPLDDMEYFDRIRAVSERILFCAEARAYYRSALPGSLSGIRSDEAWTAISFTLHRSTNLLLTLEDSMRTRHAGATILQRFIFEAYPRVPALLAQAARRVRELGGTDLRPEYGNWRRAASIVFGWRLAKRLHNLWMRLSPVVQRASRIWKPGPLKRNPH
jgi:GT2 family glycosyltransferase